LRHTWDVPLARQLDPVKLPLVNARVDGEPGTEEERAGTVSPEDFARRHIDEIAARLMDENRETLEALAG
jgi:hypothetical protein